MHRLTFAAMTMLGAMVCAGSEAQAQFGCYRRPPCGFRGFYGPGPVAYGYGGFGPFGYSAYGFSGISFGGLNVGIGTVGPYPYPFAPAYPVYPVQYSYVLPEQVVVQAQPANLDGPPFNNPVINEWMPRQPGNVVAAPNAQAAPEVVAQPQPRPQPVIDPQVLLRPSTPEGRRRSIRAMALGDEAARVQNWTQAYIKYKEAASAAKDQAEPHFRMGLTLAMMSRFNLAVDAFKRGLQVNPGWPATATLLDDFLGDRNVMAKQSMLSLVTRWVREDIRDPDRLFLAGVLLFLDQDLNRATPFLKTADQLAGSPSYTQAFLNVQPVDGQPDGRGVVPADRQLPPATPPAVNPPAAVEPVEPQPSVPPQALPGDDGPTLTLPDQSPPATPPKGAIPDSTPAEASPAPAAGPSPPARMVRPQPRVVPRGRADDEDGLGPLVPVLPAPKRASIDPPQTLQGPELLPQEEAVAPTQAVVASSKFEPSALPRNSAVVFRGGRQQRYVFFPRPARKSATVPSDGVKDVFSR